MSYNQGLGGGYPHHHTANQGVNPMQNYGANAGGLGNQSYGTGGGDYVLPPQSTGAGSGLGTGAGYGATGTGPGSGLGTGVGYGAAGTGAGSGLGTGAGYGAAGTGAGSGLGTGAGYGAAGTGTGTGTGYGAGTGAAGLGGAQGGMMGQGVSQYVSPGVTSFAVSKKRLSVSKGDWSITDQSGRTVFKVDGRVASIRDKRFLRDAAGVKILTMKKKLVTLHDTWQISAGDNDNVVAIVKKSSLVQFRTAMDVMLASSPTSNHTPDYQLKGDFFDRNLTVFQGAEQAALVTRQITFASTVLDKDTFGVTVFPGVDQALILALVVIMDEVFLHDNGDSD